jgi:hypothetical protein
MGPGPGERALAAGSGRSDGDTRSTRGRLSPPSASTHSQTGTSRSGFTFHRGRAFAGRPHTDPPKIAAGSDARGRGLHGTQNQPRSPERQHGFLLSALAESGLRRLRALGAPYAALILLVVLLAGEDRTGRSRASVFDDLQGCREHAMTTDFGSRRGITLSSHGGFP